MKICSLLIGSIFSVVTFAAPEKMQFDIKFPSLQKTRLAGGEMGLEMEGLLNTMEAGLPSVPVRTLKIAVPEGMQFKSASWKDGESSREVVLAPVVLASSQIPISWIGNLPKNLARGEQPFFRGETYPANSYEVSVQVLHGVQILVVNLYPVQTDKGLRQIRVSRTGSLEIQFRDGKRLARRPFAHQLDEVSTFVDNPQDVATFAWNGLREGASYDYLIISTKDLIAYSGANSLAAFQESLTSRGLNSKVVDLATLQSKVQGDDLVEKIRAYVKQEYSNNGIRFLLLAGEGRKSQPNFIPSRNLWSKVNAYFGGSTGWTPIEVDIPADTYYGSLDGEFNSNSNSHWGEPTDGAGGTDVDFLAEVTVGRAVLRNTTDLQNFVKKSTAVASAGLAKNALLLGELLFSEKDLYGDEYMDQLIGNVEEHGFTTNGFGTDWKNTKLYDRKGAWTGSAAQSQINKYGFGMINHLGHSNNSMNMRLSTSSIASFSNATPYFYYTQGCYAAGFDTGSFVDRLVVATNAAVAAVGNTSYGLAPEDPQPTLTKTPGASQMLNRVFVHTLMGGSHVALGKAHVASKEFFIGLKAAQEVRWVNWTANFFGDPSLTLDR